MGVLLLQFLDLNDVSGVVDTNGHTLHEKGTGIYNKYERDRGNL